MKVVLFGRGWRAEDRGQKSESRGQRAEVRGRRTEGGGQKSEGGKGRLEVSNCGIYVFLTASYPFEIYLYKTISKF